MKSNGNGKNHYKIPTKPEAVVEEDLTLLTCNGKKLPPGTLNNVTGFVSNSITYSLITYELVSGSFAAAGGTYYRPLTWREVDTGGTRNMTATYAATGRVSSLTVA